MTNKPSCLAQAVCSSILGQCLGMSVVLLIGAIVAPGKRTVSAVLRVLGLAERTNYQQYHRVLNCAVWSSRQASGILLHHLVAVSLLLE
jgi:hypothetical protein